MKQQAWRLLADESGFTLIEILMAVAIMAVLAAAAVPSVTSYLGAASNSAWNADQQAIQAAADAYYSEYRTLVSGTPSGTPPYPTLDGTKAATTAITSADCVLATASTPAFGPCLDFTKLMAGGRSYLRAAPLSAGLGNNTATDGLGNMTPGGGSYSWYIGSDGVVRSLPDKGAVSYP